MKLANKVAIITGAGSGMGRVSAILFAEEGAKIVVADINKKAADETVKLIQEKGGEATSVEVDVSKSNDVKNMIKSTVDTYGKIDILFNNAGYPMPPTPIVDVDEGLWDKIMAINVKGIFLAAKYALPIMLKQGGGVIINTASITGKLPRPLSSAYSASKAAAVMLTKILALEAAPLVRVNCINPVAADTPMLPQLGVTSKEAVEDFLKIIPLGRLVQPIDVAYAALFLASDEASMITGIGLDVAGGRGI